MAKKISGVNRLVFLKDSHKLYGEYNQGESANDRFMADNGHPFTEDYRKLRSIFDSLLFACNSAARFITYVGQSEKAEYWSPSLGVTQQPNGSLGGQFPYVYPSMGKPWTDYLAACAKAGWPDECKPFINPGSFVVVTQSYRTVSRLFNACEGNLTIPTQQNGVWSLQFFPKKTSHALACLKALDKHSGFGTIAQKPIVKMTDDGILDHFDNFLGEFQDGRFLPSNDLLMAHDSYQDQVEEAAYALPGAPPRPADG